MHGLDPQRCRTSGVVDAGIEFGLGKFATFGISYTGAYGARMAHHDARLLPGRPGMFDGLVSEMPHPA